MTTLTSLGQRHLDFFELERQPFLLSPDPEFLYLSPGHRECLQRIMITIELKSGLFVGIGDSGTGKSSMCNSLFFQLKNDPDFIVKSLFNPKATSEFAFYQRLCEEFDVPTSGSKSALVRQDALFNFIHEQALTHRKSLVLIIDEAQQMSPRQIEIVRTLLNLETGKEKLMQIIIFGQLEFLTTIKGKRFKNFRQRVAMSYILSPLSEDDTHFLIEHRLRTAGYRRTMPAFTHGAVKALYLASRGLPRAIIKFCNTSLIVAFGMKRRQIDEEVIKLVIESTPLKGVEDYE
jgi:type II secretory pathway predicted ATPase ExeA